jgi:prepilin-type N-terminal cleavage/methylation domain-containing protein
MTSHIRTGRSRGGFTLLELLISLVLFGVVIAGALGFVVAQSKGLRVLSDRANGVQNGRFGRDLLRQELRTAGTNVTEEQPIIVLANDSAFAFNADLTSNRRDSVGLTSAVYVDEFAPDAQVTAMTLDVQQAVRGATPAIRYPLQSYSQSASVFINSEAELVTFWFAPDSSDSHRTYALWRRVNGAPPELVSSGLTRSRGAPFLRYYYDASLFSTSATGLQQVPGEWMPLTKQVARRGVESDTGTAVSRRIDALRAVEVLYEATPPKGDAREVVRYMVPLPNVANARQSRACGRPPLLPSTPTVVWRADSQMVQITIPRAVDDGAGERDVIRYVLWRQQVGAGTWGEPISTVAATQSANYTVRDAGQPVRPGNYRYALAVQDCTPNVSGLAISAPVVVP